MAINGSALPMTLALNRLNIPLERKDRLGFWVVGACVLVIFASAFFSPPFATVFAAACIVGLPALLLLLVFPLNRYMFKSWGVFGRLIFYLLFFLYIALAKSFLIPVVIAIIQHILA